MSAIRCSYHLDQAKASLAVAMDHLRHAETHDVDPEVAGAVYADARGKLDYVTTLCVARGIAHGPDLDRERAAIDAEREAT